MDVLKDLSFDVRHLMSITEGDSPHSAKAADKPLMLYSGIKKSETVLMMQRILLVSLFVLTSAPAHGEWMLIDRNDQLGMSLYADPDTIRRRGDEADMWALYDYKDPQTRSSGDAYSSRKVQSKYNCTEKVKRLIDVEEFSGHMGNGKVVHKQSHLFSTEQPTRWTPIHPGGGESLWKMACKHD